MPSSATPARHAGVARNASVSVAAPRSASSPAIDRVSWVVGRGASTTNMQHELSSVSSAQISLGRTGGVAAAKSEAPTQVPRYRVEIPFHPATNGVLLNLPYELPDGAIVDRQIRPEERSRSERPKQLSTTTQTFTAEGTRLDVESPRPIPPWRRWVIRLLRGRAPLEGQYRYCVTLRAASAEEAVSRVESAAKDLLAAIAARQMAFELGPTEKRFFKRLDPPTDPIPDTELPFETLNISNADPALLAARLDPTGKRRRKGMIFSSVADPVVRRESLEIDSELYAGHESWDDRIRRAAEVYRLALSSRDEVVRFLLGCLVLEVLVDHESVAILSVRFATKPERNRLAAAINQTMAAAGLTDEDRGRIIARARQTEVQSYTTSAANYLNELELAIPPENLGWIQRQRGMFVHSGQFDDSNEAALRRNEFIKIVGVAMQREMARVAGRSFDGLVEAVTFSWLQVWDVGEEELRLQPG